MIHLSVFLLSLSSITFEILLARIFSISQWNHLSFMVISIAMFGFAAGGVAVQVFDRSQEDSIRNQAAPEVINLGIMLYSAAVLIALWLLSRIPLDYFRLTVEKMQVAYLLLSYLSAALPFFFAGFVISSAYVSAPGQSGLLYFAGMTGSALGAIVPALFLPFLDESRLTVSAGIAPLLIPVLPTVNILWNRFSGRKVSFRKNRVLLILTVGLAGSGAFFITETGSQLVAIRPSVYKALSQTLQFPDARITKTRTDLQGRIDRVESRFIRFAPGLSLKFSGQLPAQSALFKDGDSPLILYLLNSFNDADFVKDTLSYAGYHLNPTAEKVLVIQNGGGMGILCAIASGKTDIEVIEQNPTVAALFQRHYNVPVTCLNPRAFLSQTRQQFGIIQIENWGSALPGTAALDQEHFFTIETLQACLKLLTADGVIILSRRLILPPTDILRLWAAAYEALRFLGLPNPEKHLAVLRNWDTVVLIISDGPLQDTTVLKNFAAQKNFDLAYLPGLPKDAVNRFNVFEQPYYYTEISRLTEAYRSGNEKTFFASYPLDIKPQSDARPFPSSFLKWSRLREFHKSTGSRLDSFFISGEMVAAAVLIESIAVALLLLFTPRFFATKRGTRPPAKEMVYFLLIGAGFMLVEIYFIKKFVFLFGSPMISLTVVLAGMLVSSGIGGLMSRNLKGNGLYWGLIGLVLTLITLYSGLDSLIERMLSWKNYEQYLAAVLILLPPGILMGLPFPVGMRLLPESPYSRANAWALNGCASVTAAIAAVHIAMGIGIDAILVCALSAYAGAWAMIMLYPSAKRL